MHLVDRDNFDKPKVEKQTKDIFAIDTKSFI